MGLDGQVGAAFVDVRARTSGLGPDMARAEEIVSTSAQRMSASLNASDPRRMSYADVLRERAKAMSEGLQQMQSQATVLQAGGSGDPMQAERAQTTAWLEDRNRKLNEWVAIRSKIGALTSEEILGVQKLRDTWNEIANTRLTSLSDDLRERSQEASTALRERSQAMAQNLHAMQTQAYTMEAGDSGDPMRAAAAQTNAWLEEQNSKLNEWVALRSKNGMLDNEELLSVQKLRDTWNGIANARLDSLAPSHNDELAWHSYASAIRGAAYTAVTGNVSFESVAMTVRGVGGVANDLQKNGLDPLKKAFDAVAGSMGPVGWGAAALGTVFVAASAAANSYANDLKRVQEQSDQFGEWLRDIKGTQWEKAYPQVSPELAAAEAKLEETRRKVSELGPLQDTAKYVETPQGRQLVAVDEQQRIAIEAANADREVAAKRLKDNEAYVNSLKDAAHWRDEEAKGVGRIADEMKKVDAAEKAAAASAKQMMDSLQEDEDRMLAGEAENRAEAERQRQEALDDANRLYDVELDLSTKRGLAEYGDYDARSKGSRYRTASLGEMSAMSGSKSPAAAAAAANAKPSGTWEEEIARNTARMADSIEKLATDSAPGATWG